MILEGGKVYVGVYVDVFERYHELVLFQRPSGQ